MTAESKVVDASWIRRWVWASVGGWWLGFFLVLVLSTAASAIGREGQFPVGVGMGAGVGLAQGLVLRRRLGGARPWLLASTVGLGTPFVIGDLLSAFGVAVPTSLPLFVLVGAALAGLLEARLLSVPAGRAGAWIAASVAGWLVPVGLLSLQQMVNARPGPVGALIFLAGLALGGPVLGLVTGLAMPRQQLPAED